MKTNKRIYTTPETEILSLGLKETVMLPGSIGGAAGVPVISGGGTDPNQRPPKNP